MKKTCLEETKKKLRCLVYLSVEGDERSVSVKERKQMRYISDYAKAHQIGIVKKIHRDVLGQGVVNRHWNNMIQIIRLGLADGILLSNMDAVSVDLADAFWKIGKVKEAGGVVITVDEGKVDIATIKKVGGDGTMKPMKRGDIIYVDLGQHAKSSVQSGTRPCVIVSNNKSNEYSKILCVCPFTVKLKDNPVHVKIKPEDVKGYFEKESDCLAEQIVTIDKRRVISKVGHIPENSEAMKAINRAIGIQLGVLNL